MKTKLLPKSGGQKDVRSSQFRYGKVAEQRAVNRFLTAKSLTPRSQLSLSSRYGRVIVRVLSADEIKEKQKQGRQIAVLGKMGDVTPRMAFVQARKVALTGRLPILDKPTPKLASKVAAAAIKNLRPSETQGNPPSPTDFDFLNFQKITKFFHNTHYYYQLSKLK